MTITTTAQPAYSARKIAEQLLASFNESLDAERSQISLSVIEALRQMVDETKHQDPQRAMQIARVSSTAANCLTDRQAQAIAAWAMATAHVFLFELADALTHYRTAEEIFRSTGQIRQLVSVQSPQIYVLNALGEPTAALTLADTVRPHCHVLGKEGLAALVNLEMNVGTVLIQQGQFEASLAACERASIAAAQLEDNAALGRIAINRANVFQELDRYADAETAYRDARRTLVASHQNRQQVALVDLNLGLLAIRRGDYWHALQHLEESREGYVSAAHLAWVDVNRASVYQRLNLNSETVAMAAAAVEAATHIGSTRDVAVAKYVWAQAAAKEASLQVAEALFQEALTLFQAQGAEAMVAQVQLAQAEFSLQQGQMSLALSHLAGARLSPALQVIPSFAAQAKLIEAQLALLDSPPDCEKTRNLASQALTLLGSDHQNNLYMRGWRLLGRAYRLAGDFALAQNAYRQAMTVAIDMRQSLLLDEFQVSFHEEQLPVFLEAAALWIEASADPTEIAYILAMATTTPKAQSPIHASAQALGEQKSDEGLVQDAELARLRSDWHWQQSKVERLFGSAQDLNSTEMAGAQHALRQIEVQISDAWRRAGARSYQTEQSRTPIYQLRQWQAQEYATHLQQALPANEAYLHFFVIAEKLHALLVTSNRLCCLQIGTTTGIDSALRSWRHHLRDWALISAQPTLARQIAARPLTNLYRALFEPLRTELQSVEHLNLMLPPQWSDLPVAALLDDGKPLIDRWSVTQLVSPLSLLEAPLRPISSDLLSSANRAKRKGLLVGLSTQAGLTQSKHELERILAIEASDWSHQLLLDEAASSEAILSAMVDCDLLHIASHALFRADNPLFSWLQLADGRLTVAELYHRVRLRRQPLTVLSACETARGQHSGLLGVARALLASGANELIATQWKIEDHASAELMAAFYQQWFLASDDALHHAATSLAIAQRQVASLQHPVYWAGFVNIR